MIKIGYFGDGPWASRALSHIIEESGRFSIGFVVPRYDRQDPALKDWAERLGVPFLPSPDVNDPAFIEKIGKLGCELLVSMSFNQILKEAIIEAAPLGFINCHAGALPFYRGRNPLNWVLINGEKEFGVTVHYVDRGIDTGDIIVRRLVPVLQEDDYASLLEKAYEACAETLLEALRLIEKRESPRQAQATIHPTGFYCGRRQAGDEWIDWAQPSAILHDFIRALSAPGPGARTLSEKGEMALLGSRLILGAPAYRATPGEVVGLADDGVVVKTGDSTLLVIRAAVVGEGGEAGAPFTPRWRIGTRLGLSPLAEVHRLHSAVERLEAGIAELRAEIDNMKSGPQTRAAGARK